MLVDAGLHGGVGDAGQRDVLVGEGQPEAGGWCAGRATRMATLAPAVKPTRRRRARHAIRPRAPRPAHEPPAAGALAHHLDHRRAVSATDPYVPSTSEGQSAAGSWMCWWQDQCLRAVARRSSVRVMVWRFRDARSSTPDTLLLNSQADSGRRSWFHSVTRQPPVAGSISYPQVE